jgi:hypothetical protein
VTWRKVLGGFEIFVKEAHIVWMINVLLLQREPTSLVGTIMIDEFIIFILQ